jgi:hypothetical protein
MTQPTPENYSPRLFKPVRSTGAEPKQRNHIYIPSEIKHKDMWLIASGENGEPDGKIPCVVTDSDKLQRFSKRMGHLPLPYSIAESMYDKYGYDFGICLNADDHYFVIDLDYKNLPQSDVDKRLPIFKQILLAFKDSYIEVSKSGTGFHILCKSELLIARNFRNLGIEMYSYRDRFILLTGNKITVSKVDDEIIIHEDYLQSPTQKSVASVNEPIGYRDEQITQLLTQLGNAPCESEEIVLVEEPITKTNDDVFNEIITTSFSEKLFEITSFTTDTDWSTTRYPSASEAVLSFVSIVARFTKSNEQVRSLFKELCDISNRDKYIRSNYHIDRCLTIVRTELDTTEVDDFMNNTINMYYEKQKVIMENRIKSEMELLNAIESAAEFSDDMELDMVEIEKQYYEENEAFRDIPYPHGVVGDIARFSHATAPHKLRVGHIASALVTIAGIIGRQIRFRSSATNLAIIVVAPSTMGKETCAKTLAAISKSVSSVGGDKFFCFDKIASGGALRTLMSSREYGTTAVTLPEFAQLVEQMKQGKDNPMSGLKSELLDAITKNSKDSVYGGSQHANAENNRESMVSPAFSMIGDTVPDFYDGVTEEMCSGGFLSRFIIMEHEGTTKYKSDDNAHKVQIERNLVDDLTTLVQHIQILHSRNEFVEVDVTCPIVGLEFKKYEEYLLAKFNKSKDEAHRQIYGRTLLKTMVVATILAYTRNHCNPQISMEDFLWARNLIMRDVFRIEHKLNNGEIGTSERTCRLKVESLIKRMVNSSIERDKLAQAKWGDLLDVGIFSRSILSQRLQGQSFKIGSLSNIKTLELIVDNMIKNGDIMELSPEAKDVLGEAYSRSIRGKYYIVNSPKYIKHLEKVIKNK